MHAVLEVVAKPVAAAAAVAAAFGGGDVVCLYRARLLATCLRAACKRFLPPVATCA